MNYTISEEILETLLVCQNPMDVSIVIDEIKKKNQDKDIDWGVEGREGMIKRSQSLRYYISNIMPYGEYRDNDFSSTLDRLWNLEIYLKRQSD